jgi:replicative DNA helicase
VSQPVNKVTPFPGNDVGRSLPHSEEAERCLLGSLLLNPQAIHECIEKLPSLKPEQGGEYFYNENHGLIYRTLLDMAASHEPIDLVTFTQKLAGRNQLERVGGAAAITQLFNAVPTAANLEFYIDIVRQRHRRRQLIQVGTEIVRQSYDTVDEQVETLVDDVERMVFDIAEEKNARGVVSSKDLVGEAFDEIDEIIKHKGKIRGISSGFSELNKLTDGLQKGSMIIIAARPSMGKTSLAMNIAEHAAIHNSEPIPVGVFSLEMPAVQLVIRMLCSVAEVSMSRLRAGITTQPEHEALIKAADKIKKANILIDDTGGLTIMELRAKARRMKARHDIGLLVVDYLQLMRAPSRNNNDNRQQEIATISGNLKALAKELEIPIIVLSQVNREAEKRESGLLRLSDLRESGAIEQDADVVALICPKEEREDGGEPATEGTTQAILYVAKNRNGPQGKVPLLFRREITRFFESTIEDSDVPMPSGKEEV